MIEINGKTYRELRCGNCRKLICHEYIFAGRLAYTCPRCGETSTFTFKHLKTQTNDATMDKEFVVTQKGGE